MQKQPFRIVLKKRCSENCIKFTGDESTHAEAWYKFQVKQSWLCICVDEFIISMHEHY